MHVPSGGVIYGFKQKHSTRSCDYLACCLRPSTSGLVAK